MTLPFTLANGTTADASQVQADLEALVARLGNLKNADIAAAAGIENTKLAKPYQLIPLSYKLIGTSGTALAVGGTTGMFTINQAAMTAFAGKIRLPLRSGQQAWLASVEWYVARVDDNATGNWPKLDLTVDGVQIGAQEFTVNTDDSYYTIANANEYDSPLLPVTDQSVFIPRIGATASPGSDVKIAEVTLTLTLKVEALP